MSTSTATAVLLVTAILWAEPAHAQVSLAGTWDGVAPGGGLVYVDGTCTESLELHLAQTGDALTGTATLSPGGSGVCIPLYSLEQPTREQSPAVVFGLVREATVTLTVLAGRRNHGVPNQVSAVVSLSGTVGGDFITAAGRLFGPRAWVDANGNLTPECDLTNPAANGECGPLSGPPRAVMLTLTRTTSQ